MHVSRPMSCSEHRLGEGKGRDWAIRSRPPTLCGLSGADSALACSMGDSPGACEWGSCPHLEAPHARTPRSAEEHLLRPLSSLLSLVEQGLWGGSQEVSMGSETTLGAETPPPAPGLHPPVVDQKLGGRSQHLPRFYPCNNGATERERNLLAVTSQEGTEPVGSLPTSGVSLCLVLAPSRKPLPSVSATETEMRSTGMLGARAFIGAGSEFVDYGEVQVESPQDTARTRAVGGVRGPAGPPSHVASEVGALRPVP